MQRNSHRRYRGLGRRVGIAAALALASLSGFTFLAREHARWEYQNIAEQAALAGVESLRESSGQNETQRRSAAIEASRLVAEKIGSARVAVSVSVKPIRVAVELADASDWLGPLNGGLNVVGKAGYAPATSDRTAIGVRQQASLDASDARYPVR